MCREITCEYVVFPYETQNLIGQMSLFSMNFDCIDAVLFLLEVKISERTDADECLMLALEALHVMQPSLPTHVGYKNRTYVKFGIPGEITLHAAWCILTDYNRLTPKFCYRHVMRYLQKSNLQSYSAQNWVCERSTNTILNSC